MIKKLFTFIFSIFVMFSLVGCNKEEYVQVHFVSDEKNFITSVSKGDVITEEFLGSIEPDKYYLFYDNDNLKCYNNEKLYNDTTVYIKKVSFNDELTEDILIKLSIECYLIEQHKKSNKITINNIEMTDYLGKYDNAIVGVFSNDKEKILDKSFKIDNLEFNCDKGNDILLFLNKKFYKLKDAFNEKLLSNNDIYDIYNKYNHIDDYILNDEIKDTILNIYFKENTLTDDIKNDTQIRFYFGKYNDAYVAMISHDLVAKRLEIKGQRYVVKCKEKEYYFGKFSDIISVYYNNKYYILQEAYDKNILNDEDIEKIYSLYNLMIVR